MYLFNKILRTNSPGCSEDAAGSHFLTLASPSGSWRLEIPRECSKFGRRSRKCPATAVSRLCVGAVRSAPGGRVGVCNSPSFFNSESR